MTKRITEKEKEEIVKCFTEGKTIDELACKYNSTKSTISRNLKKILGEKNYKELILKGKLHKQTSDKKLKAYSPENKNLTNKIFDSEKINKNDFENEFSLSSFVEITPLDYKIENDFQKDLSSIPISDMTFPKIVYLIIGKKTELEIKLLKDYPDWEFLSEEELNRKTIEIHYDLQTAKRICGKEQKVIKVPNTEVLRIVSSLLVARGITRIVSPEKLIAL